jgi:hypothetical protein
VILSVKLCRNGVHAGLAWWILEVALLMLWLAFWMNAKCRIFLNAEFVNAMQNFFNAEFLMQNL